MTVDEAINTVRSRCGLARENDHELAEAAAILSEAVIAIKSGTTAGSVPNGHSADPERQEWRVGLKVRFKYRMDALKILLGGNMVFTVVSVHPDGYDGIQDPSGVIKITRDGLLCTIAIGADRMVTA